MDSVLHITPRPMPSSTCNRRHPKAWAGSSVSDSGISDHSGHFSVAMGAGDPLGMERKRRILITLLGSPNLFWVLFLSTMQPPDLLLAPGGSPPKWNGQGFYLGQQEEGHWHWCIRSTRTGPGSPIVLVNGQQREDRTGLRPRAAWPSFHCTCVLWNHFCIPLAFVKLCIFNMYNSSWNCLFISSYRLSSFLLSPSPDGEVPMDRDNLSSWLQIVLVYNRHLKMLAVWLTKWWHLYLLKLYVSIQLYILYLCTNRCKLTQICAI